MSLRTPKVTIWRKLLLLVFIPLAFEILFVSVLFALLQSSENQSDQFDRSRRAIIAIQSSNRDIAHSVLKVVAKLRSSPDVVNAELDRTIEACKRNREVIANAGKLRPELAHVIDRLPDLFDQTIQMIEARRAEILGDSGRTHVRMIAVRKTFFPFLYKYNRANVAISQADLEISEKEPREQKFFQLAILLTLLVALILSILISAGASILFARKIVRRLQTVEDQAQLLAFQNSITAADFGSDEIADLSEALQSSSAVLAETRRKELALLDVATDVICSLDKGLRFTAVSAASQAAWGYGSDELLGKNLTSLHDSKNEVELRSAFSRIAADNLEGEFESRLRCNNGTVKDIFWSIQWTDQTNSFYCVAHDVSDKRDAERMRQRFISIASHDLRTPLTSISVSLSVLAAGGMGKITPDTEQVLMRADRDLERLMELIKDLLDLEKLEAGKLVMKPAVVSALDLCLEACDTVEHLAQSLQVQIVRPHNDVVLHADQRGLTRVLVNFLSNAIRVSPPGGKVTVRIENRIDNVEISVIDEGSGVSAEDQRNIFQCFRQSKSVGIANMKGPGLGLAISKLIVEGHQGNVGIENIQGGGCRFFFTIPSVPGAGDS